MSVVLRVQILVQESVVPITLDPRVGIGAGSNANVFLKFRIDTMLDKLDHCPAVPVIAVILADTVRLHFPNRTKATFQFMMVVVQKRLVA
jgi:hypothetical protein